MKQNYESPELEIVTFETVDVICASGDTPGEGGGEGGW